MPLLSFVIPAYNAENYIHRCLSSISPILSAQVEAIVVDDGSTDQTLSIVERMVQTTPHLHYVHQHNQGQSVARNEGLSRASGEYIWFLDADDHIDTTCLQPLFQALATRENDLVVIGRIDEQPTGNRQNQHLWDATYPSGVAFFNQAVRRGVYRTQPWDKIVRRSFLLYHQILFEPNRMFEDMLHGLHIILNAHTTQLLNIYPYRYVLTNPNSLTRQVRPVDLDAIYFTDKASRLLAKNTYALKPSDGSFLTLVFSFLSSCLLKKYIPLARQNPDAQVVVDQVFQNKIFRQAARYCATHWVGLVRTLMAQLICVSPTCYQRVTRLLLQRHQEESTTSDT